MAGSLGGQYAAPVTDAAGDTYTGNYFLTGQTSNTNPPGYIDISCSAPGGEKALALLWGSVDLRKQITFLMNGTVIEPVFGIQIDAQANGSQGFGGSFYVLLNLSKAFNEIQLSSGVTSFEAAEFEADPDNVFVPEPASVALLGAGLVGLTLMRRRGSAL